MFGLGLWLPDLFSKFEMYQILYPNQTVTVQELASLHQVTNTTCEPSFKPSVIQNTIAISGSAIVYNVISSWLSTKIHAKTITMVSMILGGICAGSIVWMKTSLQNLIVACIFQATMVTANMTIAGIGVELFPTKVNTVAVCFIMCSGRIGAAFSNALFGWLINKQCEIPITLVALIAGTGGILCTLVPKSGRSLDNIAPQIKVSVINDSWKP